MDEFITELLDGLGFAEPATLTLTQGELVRVAISRGVSTPAKLWRQSAAELRKTLGQLSAAEVGLAAEHRRAREAYAAWDKAALLAEAKKRDLPSAGASREKLIDRLAAAADHEVRPQALDHDEDQRALLERFEDPALYVSAGPGAGKTTTLCALVHKALAEHPESRILVLAFNREAEHILTERLRWLGVPLSHKRLVSSPDASGCFVLTFDKYVWWRGTNSAADDFNDVYGDAASDSAPVEDGASDSAPVEDGASGSAEDAASDLAPAQEDAASTAVDATGDFRLAFERGAAKPPPAAERWDWLIVDEAQDVDATRGLVVEGLRPRARHFVAAGDPRQELYAGTSWFSTAWAAAPAA
ncbi:MAG: AAA family ATPase, partial [Gemmatimonadaceae bacterium]